MKKTTLVVMGLLLLLPFAACSPGEDEASFEIEPGDEARVAEPETQSQAPGVLPENALESSVSGEVIRVDQDLGTVSVRDSDNIEWVFSFSDATEITGESGAQGLAGTEGSRVVVYYRGDDPGSRNAVRIEVLEDEAPDISIGP